MRYCFGTKKAFLFPYPSPYSTFSLSANKWINLVPYVARLAPFCSSSNYTPPLIPKCCNSGLSICCACLLPPMFNNGANVDNKNVWRRIFSVPYIYVFRHIQIGFKNTQILKHGHVFPKIPHPSDLSLKDYKLDSRLRLNCKSMRTMTKSAFIFTSFLVISK